MEIGGRVRVQARTLHSQGEGGGGGGKCKLRKIPKCGCRCWVILIKGASKPPSPQSALIAVLQNFVRKRNAIGSDGGESSCKLINWFMCWSKGRPVVKQTTCNKAMKFEAQIIERK